MAQHKTSLLEESQHTQRGPWSSITQVMAANERRGHHFFDRASMRGFGSIVYPEIFWGRYFVTSERDRGVSTSYGWMQANQGRRLFTVRRAEDDGSINTVGGFGQFTTKRQAQKYAAHLLDAASTCANCRQPTYNQNFTCDTCAKQ